MSDVPAFVSTGGLLWIVGGFLIAFLALSAWALCRAADLGDRQSEGWEIEDLDWQDWPWEKPAGTSWRS